MKSIIEKIKKGEIKMRPKWHFILKTLLVILGAVVACLFALFLVSFIFFSVRGARGPLPALFALPWILVFLSVILIVVLELLVRYFSFGYRRPILYTVLGIIIVVMLGSMLISRTRMHYFFLEREERGEFPIMRPLYHGFGRPELRDFGRPEMPEPFMRDIR